MKRMFSARLLIGLTCLLAWFGAVRAADRSPAAMASAAEAFLKGLTPELRQQASLPFEGDERFRWHFVPIEMFPRNGLPIRLMSEPQRAFARKLLESGLSQRGYLTATGIMELESVLGELEAAGRSRTRQGNRMVRDPELYFFSVFGTPSAKGTWGWRVDGHHVSLNFTVVHGNLVASSPSFFGSNPAQVPDGPKKGLRLLALQEDTARALAVSLDESQRSRGLISATAPDDIATMNSVSVSSLSPSGISADALTPKQRDLLMAVVEAYTGAMANDLAADRMAKVRRVGVEKIAFAWAGELERGKRHYYRVQGPSFLIEYDNTQNGANHIHAVWRDFEGDFGRDLLREHLKSTAH